MLKICQDLGVGAQFGGKYFAHDARVVRLPRPAFGHAVRLLKFDVVNDTGFEWSVYVIDDICIYIYNYMYIYI